MLENVTLSPNGTPITVNQREMNYISYVIVNSFIKNSHELAYKENALFPF